MPTENLSSWTPDSLPGFEQTTFTGLSAPDGPAEVVLVRRRSDKLTSKAVLYIHGYCDYFFQTHLADFFNNAGLNFYAVDLRRHGRSMRAHQLPNYTSDVDEYLQDIDAAITVLKNEEGVDWLLLNGHSTGGLVAALYGHRGQNRKAVDAIFLNSPFFEFNIPPWQKWVLAPTVAAIGATFPLMRLPPLPGVYGESLHADHHGTWRYNTQFKPIEGFPVYAGWFRAIHTAHAEINNGLSIEVPVLVMHAKRSSWTKRWNQEAMTTDIVLDIADMVRLSPKLGHKVEVRAIADGIHDLALSKQLPRKQFFKELSEWLVRVGDQQTRTQTVTLGQSPR